MTNHFLKSLKDYFLITLGTVMLTIGVYFFKIPNGFATGGVSGIGTLLGKLTERISPPDVRRGEPWFARQALRIGLC